MWTVKHLSKTNGLRRWSSFDVPFFISRQDTVSSKHCIQRFFSQKPDLLRFKVINVALLSRKIHAPKLLQIAINCIFCDELCFHHQLKAHSSHKSREQRGKKYDIFTNQWHNKSTACLPYHHFNYFAIVVIASFGVLWRVHLKNQNMTDFLKRILSIISVK